MTTYTNPFTGQTIQPSQVGYELLTLTANLALQWPINGNDGDTVANIIEVDATIAGLELAMPPATQVSTGQSTLITNIGANTFTVTDVSGNTIASVTSGVTKYIYVTDNSTEDGQWAVFTFGTGTSAADALTLAGYGLKAIGATLNQAYVPIDYYVNATLAAANRAEFAVWQGGVGTITLPVAADVGSDWFCMIRNNGSGLLTIAPTGTDTLDGNASQQLQLTESFVVVSNGVDGYYSFGYGQAVQFVFTQLSKTVTGGTVTLTTPEAANIIQEYYGTLTSNCDVVLPSTVQLYSLNNLTTGSFNLTFKTAAVGGATVTLPQNQTLIVICDGTNVYNANTAAISALTSITLGSGTAGTPSLNYTGDTGTGIYHPASSQIGFSLGGANVATLTTTGFRITVGIAGGTF